MNLKAYMAEGYRTYQRFEQDEVWADSFGVRWPIKELETRHLNNIIRFLEKRAARLAFLHGLGSIMATEMPFAPTEGTEGSDEIDRALQELWSQQVRSPLGWLMETPLMKALYKERTARLLQEAKDFEQRVTDRLHREAAEPRTLRSYANPSSREQSLEKAMTQVLMYISAGHHLAGSDSEWLKILRNAKEVLENGKIL